MSKIKLIIIDFDNTLEQFYLLDSKAERHLGSVVNKRFGISKLKFLRLWNQEKNNKKFNEINVKKDSRLRWLKIIFKKININISDVFLKKLENIYWKKINDSVYLYPGVKKVLKKLKKRYKLVLFSNSDGSKDIKLKRIKKFNLEKFFDLILTTDDTGFNKPDKRNIEFIMRKFNVRPNEMIVVGDYPRLDLEVPKKLGAITILTTQSGVQRSKKRYADFEINDIRELPNLIKKIDFV